MIYKIFSLLLALLFFIGCSSNDDDSVSNSNDNNDSIVNPQNSPNVLLVIVDDLGKDAISGYSEGLIKPNTPYLDSLRQHGITFNNFWVYPTCSPTRSAILTGKYGYQTGVKWAGDILNSSEISLHKYIKDNSPADYSTALIGKWHLTGNQDINPEIFGIDFFKGITGGAVSDYYNWPLYEDGNTITESIYATEKITDISKDWIHDQDNSWFLWLAYNAPHTPFHNPPQEMHSQGALPPYSNGIDATPYYMASIEAIDYQLGELFKSLSVQQKENTVVIFMADNGTPTGVAQSPYNNRNSKGTLYGGGINTPLFICGKGVERIGEIDENILTSTDLFSTIAEITGIDVSEVNDSKSFYSLLKTSGVGSRKFQYSEKDNGSNPQEWTISNGNYKIIVNENGEEQFYDLNSDPYETMDRLRNGNLNATFSTAKQELESELRNIRN